MKVNTDETPVAKILHAFVDQLALSGKIGASQRSVLTELLAPTVDTERKGHGPAMDFVTAVANKGYDRTHNASAALDPLAEGLDLAMGISASGQELNRMLDTAIKIATRETAVGRLEQANGTAPRVQRRFL